MVCVIDDSVVDLMVRNPVAVVIILVIHGRQFRRRHMFLLSFMSCQTRLDLVRFPAHLACVRLLRPFVGILMCVQVIQRPETLGALIAAMRSVFPVYCSDVRVKVCLLTKSSAALFAGPVPEHLMGRGKVSLKRILSVEYLPARRALIFLVCSRMFRAYMHVERMRARIFLPTSCMGASKLGSNWCSTASTAVDGGGSRTGRPHDTGVRTRPRHASDWCDCRDSRRGEQFLIEAIGVRVCDIDVGEGCLVQRGACIDSARSCMVVIKGRNGGGVRNLAYWMLLVVG